MQAIPVFEENSDIFLYLKKRNLISQYKKAKQLISSGFGELANLKKRQPKSKDIWYFRVNKQYRAWAIFRDGELLVFEISDHKE